MQHGWPTFGLSPCESLHPGYSFTMQHLRYLKGAVIAQLQGVQGECLGTPCHYTFEVFTIAFPRNFTTLFSFFSFSNSRHWCDTAPCCHAACLALEVVVLDGEGEACPACPQAVPALRSWRPRPRAGVRVKPLRRLQAQDRGGGGGGDKRPSRRQSSAVALR